MHLSDVNFLAVGLATVLTFGLGALWYSPLLFAKAWMAGHGYTQADIEAMQASMGPNYAISFVCWFVMATMLAMIAPHFGAGAGTIFAVGLHMWLGFLGHRGADEQPLLEQASQRVADRRRLPDRVHRDHVGGAGTVAVETRLTSVEIGDSVERAP